MAPGKIEAGKSLFYVISQLKSYSNHQTSLNTVWLGSQKTFEGCGGRSEGRITPREDEDLIIDCLMAGTYDFCKVKVIMRI